MLDGFHQIAHEGITVPIEVDGDEVLVDVKGTEGDLDRAVIFVGDFPTLAELKNSGVTKIAVCPKEGHEALMIYGIPDKEGNETYIVFERHRPSWYKER